MTDQEKLGRRLTVAYVIFGVAIVLAAAFAIMAFSSAHSSCQYQKEVYPSSKKFRTDVKGFMRQTYVQLTAEAQIYREAASKQASPRSAAVLDTLANHDARAAARALKAWDDIVIPGPPSCS